MPATKILKEHRQWSAILAGSIVVAALITTCALYLFTEAGIVGNNNSVFKAILYTGLCVILISACAAFWIARTEKTEAPSNLNKDAGAGSNHDQRTDDAHTNSRHTISYPVPTEGVKSAGGEVDAFFESVVFRQYRNTHRAGAVSTGPGELTAAASHNIQERKKIELEIQHQNRKITESMRYAKRIQAAILPNTRVIDKVLPDSFILYKPRDVVSGDFPWFAHVKDDIFMAAVDCTGHGVPGALLSLVGYFLLNDIVRGRRITDTGKILDLLNEGVSATLRPDEEAGTKDGMDISLCRINLQTREIQYAGAHRSLYFLNNGIVEEIKGNKFPIGGGIFKNQSNFRRSTLHFRTGDAVFFCSDGFCDQFGGPSGRKFGTRQLKETISKVHTMTMKEAAKVFEDKWESWKGKQKQVDDVLLIGIKFS